MDERVLNEQIQLEPILNNVAEQRVAELRRRKAGAALEEKRESEVIGRDVGAQHFEVERDGAVGGFGPREASDDCVECESCGRVVGVSEEGDGVVDVAGVGDGGEEEELGGEEGVAGEAEGGDLGVDLLELGHGFALVEEREQGAEMVGFCEERWGRHLKVGWREEFCFSWRCPHQKWWRLSTT